MVSLFNFGHSYFFVVLSHFWTSLVAQTVKRLPTIWDEEGKGNPLQCSCLENPRDEGAWWAASMGSHRVGHDRSDLATIWETGVQSLGREISWRKEW